MFCTPHLWLPCFLPHFHFMKEPAGVAAGSASESKRIQSKKRAFTMKYRILLHGTEEISAYFG